MECAEWDGYTSLSLFTMTKRVPVNTFSQLGQATLINLFFAFKIMLYYLYDVMLGCNVYTNEGKQDVFGTRTW